MSVGAVYLSGTISTSQETPSTSPTRAGGASTSATRTHYTADVHMFHTANGGEIALIGGDVELADGLETFCYLALFGGNERDPGLEDARLQWWGNVGEPDPAQCYRSETQHLVRALPATPANLRRIEDAAKRDLSALLAGELATSLEAVASMPARNTLAVTVAIEVAAGEVHRYTFRESWGVRS